MRVNCLDLCASVFQSRKRICEELDIPMNALRIRIHRLRKKVESCVQEMLRN